MGILVNLSLDEPNLESILFSEDVNEMVEKENDQIEDIQ